jgi:lipoprotein-anchoring transpeptidase ErfK/SrfK
LPWTCYQAVVLAASKHLLLLVLIAVALAAAEPAPAAAAATPPTESNRAAETVVETQLELHRRGFSCGSIDGLMGPQTAAALRAFQRASGLPETGVLDAETRTLLRLTAPALTTYIFRDEDLAALRPLPATWLEKSRQSAIAYATALELVAERHRASPRFVRRLNPEIDWDAITPGAVVNVPAADSIGAVGRAARIRIGLEARELEVFDRDDRMLAHFPVSIARKVEKRPLAELRITVIVREPNYTFDPELYPESEEAKQFVGKLIVPPGPNNPVGRAWIGLNLPGYGIHGTPDPEKVGRTESHGCFRLANWDALALTNLVFTGMPVKVEP